ncbi:MAG: hypothetical protein ACRDLM_11560 [Gaiellaceae bacterium]
MPESSADAEIRALQAVYDALEPLDDEARGRVLDYTLRRLGVRDLSSQVVTPLTDKRDTLVVDVASPSTTPTTDIRSLRKEKEPTSAVEMAAVVAYYLSELAPSGEQKEAIGSADIEKYFKQAQYRLPQRIDKALHNAAAAGYFDRTGRGEFRLNPVGFNLVTHGLPRTTGQATSRPAARKRTTEAPAKSRKK